LRAGSEVALADAGARQRARAFGLETPRRDGAVVIFDVHEQPRVRIRVLKFFDGARDGDFFLIVEHDRRVMSERRRRQQHSQPKYACQSFPHRQLLTGHLAQ
jgi:hypothetical protein